MTYPITYDSSIIAYNLEHVSNGPLSISSFYGSVTGVNLISHCRHGGGGDGPTSGPPARPAAPLTGGRPRALQGAALEHRRMRGPGWSPDARTGVVAGGPRGGRRDLMANAREARGGRFMRGPAAGVGVPPGWAPGWARVGTSRPHTRPPWRGQRRPLHARAGRRGGRTARVGARVGACGDLMAMACEAGGGRPMRGACGA
jgi:hypothetical protein